jgi:hypothetical protein
MPIKPEIEADITYLPRKINPRKKPIIIENRINGYYGCPLMHNSGTWDCRMVFPDTKKGLEFGQTTRAFIQFLSGNKAIKGMNKGDTFELWELGIIAHGVINKILNK